MFPLQVELRESGQGSTLLALRGRLVGPEAVAALMAGVAGLAPGVRRLVLDLEGLEFMDCAGVGALAQIVCACRSAGRELVIMGGNSRVREILGAVGFTAHLTLADAEDGFPAPSRQTSNTAS